MAGTYATHRGKRQISLSVTIVTHCHTPMTHFTSCFTSFKILVAKQPTGGMHFDLKLVAKTYMVYKTTPPCCDQSGEAVIITVKLHNLLEPQGGANLRGGEGANLKGGQTTSACQE